MTSNPSPHNLSAATASDWFGEVMSSFRTIETSQNSERERLNISFFYPDKKLNKFSKLMAALYINAVESKKTNPNLLDFLQQALLSDNFSSLEKGSYMVAPVSSSKFESAVIMSEKNTASISLDKPHISQFFSAKEMFQSTACHEVGHIMLIRDEISSVSDKGKQLEPNYRFGLPYSFHSENTPLLLSSGIEQAVFLNYFYTQDTQKETNLRDNRLEDARIFYRDEIFYQSQHQQFSVLSQEMFADCAGILLHSKLGMPFEKALTQIAAWRSSEQGSINFAFKAAIQKGEAKNYFCFDHSTQHALTRLETLVAQRNLEPSELTYDQIVDLSKECRNYGVAAFMFECATYDPVYARYLNCLELKTPDTLTPDLFDEPMIKNEGGSSVKNNGNSKNIKALSQIFDCLEEADKIKIKENVQLTEKLIHCFKKTYYKGSITPKIRSEVAEFSKYFKIDPELPEDIQKNISLALSVYCNEIKNNQQSKDPKAFVHHGEFAVWKAVAYCVDQTFQQRKLLAIKNPDNFKISEEIALPAPETQMALWENLPEETRASRILQQKIKNLARQTIEPAFALKPQVKNFK